MRTFALAAFCLFAGVARANGQGTCVDTPPEDFPPLLHEMAAKGGCELIKQMVVDATDPRFLLNTSNVEKCAAGPYYEDVGCPEDCSEVSNCHSVCLACGGEFSHSCAYGDATGCETSLAECDANGGKWGSISDTILYSNYGENSPFRRSHPKAGRANQVYGDTPFGYMSPCSDDFQGHGYDGIFASYSYWYPESGPGRAGEDWPGNEQRQYSRGGLNFGGHFYVDFPVENTPVQEWVVAPSDDPGGYAYLGWNGTYNWGSGAWASKSSYNRSELTIKNLAELCPATCCACSDGNDDSCPNQRQLEVAFYEKFWRQHNEMTSYEMTEFIENGGDLRRSLMAQDESNVHAHRDLSWHTPTYRGVGVAAPNVYVPSKEGACPWSEIPGLVDDYGEFYHDEEDMEWATWIAEEQADKEKADKKKAKANCARLSSRCPASDYHRPTSTYYENEATYDGSSYPTYRRSLMTQDESNVDDSSAELECGKPTKGKKGQKGKTCEDGCECSNAKCKKCVPDAACAEYGVAPCKCTAFKTLLSGCSADKKAKKSSKKKKSKKKKSKSEAEDHHALTGDLF